MRQFGAADRPKIASTRKPDGSVRRTHSPPPGKVVFSIADAPGSFDKRFEVGANFDLEAKADEARLVGLLDDIAVRGRPRAAHEEQLAVVRDGAQPEVDQIGFGLLQIRTIEDRIGERGRLRRRVGMAGRLRSGELHGGDPSGGKGGRGGEGRLGATGVPIRGEAFADDPADLAQPGRREARCGRGEPRPPSRRARRRAGTSRRDPPSSRSRRR